MKSTPILNTDYLVAKMLGRERIPTLEAVETKARPAQQQFIFFKGEGPSREQRIEWLNPDNPTSPYYGFIGHRHAIEKLLPIDFAARGRYNHACPEISLAFIGPPGCGKTELAKRHCRANGLPLVEVSPRSVSSVDDLFNQIREVCADYRNYNDWITARVNLSLVEHGKKKYFLPPINVFIDEIHALNNNVVQGLLKATEPKDLVMRTESGIWADCRNVHWLIGTTDRGKLFDAFDMRFSKVILDVYSRYEIMQIVKVNYPEWPAEACKLVAHFCARWPREALAFAQEMKLAHDMLGGDWKQIALRVARNNDIDPYGMHNRRLTIIKALGQGPVADRRLPIVAGVKKEELHKFILPWLLAAAPDQEPLVTVCSKGYAITWAGIAELDKRGLSHRGEKAVA